MWITWKHDDREIPRPLSFEQKVDIFYHRLLGWQLHVAELVANGGQPLANEGEQHESVQPIPHSGFAVLQICLSYFETIGKYQRGNSGVGTDNDGEFFREGVLAVFPKLLSYPAEEIDGLLAILYNNVRSGLYHVSMSREGVFLGRRPGSNARLSFSASTKQLFIDPHALPAALREHLELYRQQLLDPKNALVRRRFEEQFERDNGP